MDRDRFDVDSSADRIDVDRIRVQVRDRSLDAIIYNKITSIVNVVRLKLFTLMSIVNKQAR